MKLSFHQILQPLQLTISLTLFCLPSLFNGSLAILPFQVKAAREATTIPTGTILPVSFSSSIQVINETIRNDPPTHESVTWIYQHQKASCDAKQINNRKDEVLLARLRSDRHPSLNQYLHRLDSSQDPICPKWRNIRNQRFRWTKSLLLAMRMSCCYNHKTTSVWELKRVLRVACHFTWGCGGVRKEDLGQPWRLTK